MTRLFRSAWVIGRRDFTATVFSKAFIFFLLGPLFPVLLGALFGGIGARVASQAEQPRIAVVGPHNEFERLDSARDRLSQAMNDRPTIQLVEVASEGPAEVQARDLLHSKQHSFVAVLSGGLDRPHLTGAIEPEGSIAGQVRLLVGEARAAGSSAPALAVTATQKSTGSVDRSRTFAPLPR